MKAVFAGAKGEVELREFNLPEVLPGQLRIRTICSLISSGTERYYLEEAKASGRTFPLGYCAGGVVERVGPNVEDFAVGDKVVAVGWGYAIHAEAINVPQRLCAKVPNTKSLEQFVFASLGATALHMIHRSDLAAGERALFVGVGPVGQIGLQLAQQVTPFVYAADRLAKRLEAALAGGSIGAVDTSFASLSQTVLSLTAEQGVAVAFLCIHGDATQTLHESLLCLHSAADGTRRGRVICVGRFQAAVSFSAEMGNVDLRVSSRCGTGYRDDRYVNGEVSYEAPANEGTVGSNLKQCVRLIESGHLRPEVFHTHRIPFTDVKTAYELLKQPDKAIAITLQYSA